MKKLKVIVNEKEHNELTEAMQRTYNTNPKFIYAVMLANALRVYGKERVGDISIWQDEGVPSFAGYKETSDELIMYYTANSEEEIQNLIEANKNA